VRFFATDVSFLISQSIHTIELNLTSLLELFGTHVEEQNGF